MAFLKLVLILFSVHFWQPVAEASNVKEFQTWKEFKSILFSTEYSIVDFYANWCPHCVSLKPIYDKASADIQKGHLKNKVRLLKIECSENPGKAICSENGITGYPTLNVYKSGKLFDQYKGKRTPEAFIQYAEHLVKNGKPMYIGKPVKQELVCLAKDFKKYVTHKW